MKLFFFDLGIRNILRGFSKHMILPTEWGKIYENYVFSCLKKHFSPNEELFFWRTKKQAEIDFIIISAGLPVPIEVKTNIRKPTVSKAMASFIEKYNSKKAFVFSKNFVGQRMVGKAKVQFLPFCVL